MLRRTALLYTGMLVATLCEGDPAPGPRVPVPPWMDASASAPALGPWNSPPPLSSLAARVAGDEYWWDGFALPELDGWAYCAVEFDGSLVIGGGFTQLAGAPFANIARWDGISWHTIGAGFDGIVLDLVVYRGELIASGWFDHSGDRPVRGIARWDGAGWAPLGAGLWLENSQPSQGAAALAVRGDVLCAAGRFDRAGGVEARHVASWNGVEWSALGSGVDREAYSLLVLGDSLYVGGPFQNAGGRPAPGIALWNGQEWFDVGGGVSHTTQIPRVVDMISYRGALVAAGYFDRAGSVDALNIAAWNHSEWQPLRGPHDDGASFGGRALAVRGDHLYVGGHGIRIWDGSSWSSPPVSVGGPVYFLLDTPQGLATGGPFIVRAPGGAFVGANIGVLGDAWTDPFAWTDRMRGLSLQAYVSVRSLVSYRGSLVAAGLFSYTGSAAGRVPVGSVASWDGTTWTPLAGPYAIYATCLLADGETLYAGGAFASNPGTSPVGRFDGAIWSSLDTLSLDPTSLALYQGKLHVGGRRMSLSHPRSGGVHRWSGARWESIGLADSPGDFPQVSSLVEYQGRLVAAGVFDAIAGVPARSVAAWDGSAWLAMDTGIDAGEVTALGACDGVLFAGGNLRDPEGNSFDLMRWDGGAWQPVPGPGRSNVPWAFECSGDRLFVGGQMDDASFVQRGITSWDGQSWSPLGSGTNGVVRTLLIHDGQLYVGGEFTRAGNRSSFGVARWDLRSEGIPEVAASLPTSVPNPFQTSTTIAYRLPAPAHVQVSVFDLRGGRVAVLEDAQRPGGTHALVWDGRDRDGHAAPPGIYLVHLDLGGRLETRRVVRLR